jgi:hypothetical protein
MQDVTFPSVIRGLRLMIGGLSFVVGLTATAATGQEVEMNFSQTIGIERTDELSSYDSGLRATLETTPYSLTTAELERTLASGLVLRFGANLRITGYPETDDATEYEGGVTAELEKTFGTDAAWRYRLTAEVDRLIEGGDWTFNRVRIGQQLRYRHDKTHMTTAKLRLGRLNQNEATFYGYDQTEYLFELGHNWRPWGDQRSINGTIFAEARRADLKRLSYDELGMRLSFRSPINDTSHYITRLSAFSRSYGTEEGIFAREDRHLKATLGIVHILSDAVQTEVYAGWDRNNSTIADRGYQGPIVGLSMTYSW